MLLASFTLKLALAHLWIGLGINCIKLLGLATPDQVRVFDVVELRCLYDLEGEKLYSLSWKFNNRDHQEKNYKEFYRFVPQETPRKQHYPLPNPQPFRVNMSESYEGNIRITMLSRNASGIYKCEVSTEHTLRTLNTEKQILVINNSSSNQKYSSSNQPLLILMFLVCLISAKHQHLL